jgi:hypothetical protein
MLSVHETVARDLLARLLEVTEQACERKTTPDIQALDSLLDARAEMLEALDRSVQALVTASHTLKSGGAGSAREKLIGLAMELEQANASLMQSARAERDVIAATMAAADRPDGIASRYSGTAPTEAHRLNLIR